MFFQSGIIFTHEAVRDWERKLIAPPSPSLRKQQHGTAGKSWYVDETYGRIDGRWQYRQRAIDRDGHLVDVRLSET